MKKTIFGLIIMLILILSLSLPAMAAPVSSIDISNFNIELISGGVVGQETTIRISADITAESISDITRYKDMAVCQGRLKYFVIDSTWYLIAQDKIEKHVYDYEYPSYNGPGAHAKISWNASIDYTWTPYMAGDHYISAEAFGYTSVTNGEWPPDWQFEYQKAYEYKIIDISEAPLGSWQNAEDFEVSIGEGFSCYQAYDFDGLILGENIDQECPIAGHSIGLQIDSGTMILGTGKILIDYDGVKVSIDIPTDAIFSKPVIITIDGVSVLTFTSITAGIPE